MVNKVDSEAELGIPLELIDMGMSFGEAGEEVQLTRTPFVFPSIGTCFDKVVAISGNKKHSCFIKRFVSGYFERPGVSMAYRRPRTRTHPAKIESSFLNAFRDEGCAVPSSFVRRSLVTSTDFLERNFLVMEDCGTTSLEETLRDKSTEEQEQVLAKLAPYQVNFSLAGIKLARKIVRGKHTFTADAIKRMSRDIEEGVRYRFNYWRPGASDKEQEEFFKKVKPVIDIIEGRPNQVILGDVSTYHIVVDQNKSPWWIDIEKIRNGDRTQDLAGLYLSPEVKLSYSAIERLLRNFHGKETDALYKEGLDKHVQSLDRILGTFCAAGLEEAWRRGTKIREFKSAFPELYEQFIDMHPGFKGAFESYRQRLEETRDRIDSNGFYTKQVRSELLTTADALLELVST
tara:strand:- start:1579 stop:2784 length:1206 start_codon:yes stop_codon:yes gene_type:complete